MANSNHPSNPAQPAPNAESDWSWLRSRLERAAGSEATHELDDWIGQQLQVLERDYADMVTQASRERIAGQLIKVRRQ